jgi:glycerol-3-phosphate dehydrogenase
MAACRRAVEGLGGTVTERLDAVAGQRFDVAVIGAGVNGAGIAREAARAGYRTLLVERNDFASGTTSRATRLIHGGLRYLEHGELGLVYESLAEREALVRDAPHLVRPLRMLVPVYEGDARGAIKVRVGLALYDALSFAKSLPRHRSLSRGALAAYEPALRTDRLRAAYTFYDAQVEFPERLVVETVRDFADAGGVALNHVAVAGVTSPGGRLRGLLLRDERTGAEAEVEAAVAVNAAGPWADEVLAGSDAERHDRLIGGTKGSHLVAAWPEAPANAVFASARSDGRPFFVLPWYRYTLIGTTDIRFDDNPSCARATAEEVQYLLDETGRLFPRGPLRREHVLYTYSGVRPLPYTAGGTEGSITRRHFVIDHVKRGGPAGLLTVVGGKLTTYRSLARIALKAIARHAQPSGAPLPAPEHPQREPYEFVSIDADPLVLYGRRRDEPASLAERDATLGARVCEHNPETLAQVAHAVEREQALTLADVLLRRVPAGWSACHALDGIDAVAATVASRLGWDAERTAEEIQAYRRELAETLVPLDAI